MNAGLDADQPTRAMTPEQLKDHAALLREFADPELADVEDVEALKTLADFLDSLTVETHLYIGQTQTPHTRFTSPWQPTTEEAHRG